MLDQKNNASQCELTALLQSSIYSGVENLSDDSDVDDDDEEEDDEEDPTAEIDLGDSEDDLPKKKKQKKA